MVEPQKLSVDLSQRWAHGGTSPAPQPQVPPSEPAPAAQAQMPPQSLVDTAVSAAEVRQSLRPIWPLGRKSSGPATPAGAAAIAVSASVASVGTLAAAKASGATLLDAKAGTTTVQVAAFATDAQAAAEELRPVSESAEAKPRRSASTSAGLGASTDGVKHEKSPLHISARYSVTSYDDITPVLTRHW